MASPEDLIFADYRRTRDPQRLAEVFDLTALDLLHLAMHLVPDPAAAEDLVQSTFLAAIESAHRHQAGRPVMPWLVGILVNHGRAARRKTRQVVDPERLPWRDQRGPLEHAQAQELSGIVARAIDEVPPLYREVLALRLEQGLSTVAIALKLRRAPGTVRSQLWRALDLVRRTLPRGAAPALSFPGVRGLAALRGEVLAAASVPAKSLALLPLLGGLMAVKTFLLSLAGIAAAVAVVWVAARPEVVAPREPAAGPAVTAQVAEPPAPESRRLERVAAAEEEAPASGSAAAASAPSAPPGLGPVLVAPYVVRIRVVDQKGAPVPDAEAALFDGRRIRTGEAPGHTYLEPVREERPLAAARTDPAGECSLRTDRELAWLRVAKEGVGRSSSISIYPTRVAAGGELVVTLLPPVALRGRVLRGDGTPAAGVLVHGDASGELMSEGSAREPEPVRTDDTGAFVMHLDPKVTTVELTARDGSRESHRVPHALRGNEEHEVVIRFPGLIGVHGLLVDAAGRPVAGGEVVVGAKLAATDRHGGFRTKVTSEASGRFTADVQDHGAYVVVANAKGHAACRPVDVRLDAIASRVEVVLRLLPPASLRGLVTREDGTPIAGAALQAMTAAHDETPWQTIRGSDTYGPVPHAKTADDGTFVLADLHPDAEYTVSCTPDPAKWRIQVARPGIRADGRTLHVVIGPEDVLTSTLAGVILGADGLPATQFELSLAQEQIINGNRRRSSMSITRTGDPDGRFAIEDLPRNGVYWLEVLIPASRDVFGRGPWTLDRERVEVSLRPPRRGAVRVIVVDMSGEPATHVPVGMDAVDPMSQGGAFMLPMRTDREGRVLYPRLAEGRYRVIAPAGKDGAARQEVEVVAGQTVEVRLTLK